jgi:hypothetical protein
MIRLPLAPTLHWPSMPLLPSRHYVSDHTRFIDDLLARKPQLENEQRVGRAIWWDKLPAEVAAKRRMDASRVPQKAYVYSNDNPQRPNGDPPRT